MRASLALLAAGLVCASPAAAATGGVSVPSGQTAAPPALNTGGVRAGDPGSVPAVRPPPARHHGRRHGRRRYPTLSSFGVSGRVFYAYGPALRVSFEIDRVHGSLPVSLGVYASGRRVRTIALGRVTAGRAHSVLLRGDRSLPEGRLELRISARGLRRGPHASGSQVVGFYGHRFPLAGPFSYLPGGEFGAPRRGHIHQGQDISAAQGTPIVAPRGGVVTTVAYQAAGAGYYVVVRGAGEGLTYVFMHLRAGSTAVRVGQTIATGQRIGQVGATGDAEGPHLHFEVWRGAWQAGGHPVDPLPYLRRWRRAT